MAKLIMTKGLPASGKTTWAKEQVKNGNGRVKRVNKDDLRAMVDAGIWSKQNEKFILDIRDKIVYEALSKGFDVIVDDTNLVPKHEQSLQDIVNVINASAWTPGGEPFIQFEIKDFTNVKLKTCLERDAERPNSVGEQVIRTMYNSFIRKKGHVAQYVKPPYSEDLPNCIIVDIDGTLAHMTDRSPYDYTKVDTDIVDENVRDIVLRYSHRDMMEEIPDTYILIVSGREDACRAETEKWLADNRIPYDEFYMRKAGDGRNDAIVKKEIYDTYIKPRFNVRFVLDDRDRVVEMWRKEGLKVLQVAEGDF